MEEKDFEIVIDPKLYLEIEALKKELLKTKFKLHKSIHDNKFLKDENKKLKINSEHLINKNNTLQSEVQRSRSKKLLINNLLPNNKPWDQKPALNPQRLFNKSPLFTIPPKRRKRRDDYDI